MADGHSWESRAMGYPLNISRWHELNLDMTKNNDIDEMESLLKATVMKNGYVASISRRFERQ